MTGLLVLFIGSILIICGTILSAEMIKQREDGALFVTLPIMLMGCGLLWWLYVAYKDCQHDVQIDIFPVEILHNQPYIFDGNKLVKVEQNRNVGPEDKVVRKKWPCDKYYRGLSFISPPAEYELEKK